MNICCKGNKKIIIFGILFLLFFGSFLCIRNYLMVDDESRIFEERLKQQEELKELINIDSLSDEFIDNYFDEVSQIEYEDKENILIVVSKEKIDNSYGAIDIIEAPNNQYFLIYDSKDDKDRAIDELSNNDNIVSVENNDVLYAEVIDDEEVGSFNSWGVEMLGYDDAIEKVNEISQNESDRIEDVVVAIIDSGLDVELFNKNYPNKLLKTYDIITPSSEMVDSNGHGTHIAGTIAESTPLNVKIMSVKVSYPGKDTFYISDLINAINYVVNDKNANVISFSIGGTGSLPTSASNAFYQSVESANQENIIFVSSAGNDNTDEFHYPSSFDNTICVSAVDSHLEKAQFSNYGNDVTFSAPGFLIKSINLNSSGVIKSGTSMSTPHVSSAVAILKSFNKDLTLDATITLLKKYAIDIGDDGFDILYGYGVVNFNDAVFCSKDVICDEYNVFEDNDVNVLKTIKIESNGKFVAKYNYGSISNIVDAEIKLYYTDDDYYIKTLSQLINDIDIIGYDPDDYSEQEVLIKYKGLETIIEVDNTNLMDGWKYEEVDNNIYLNDMFCTVYPLGNQTYSSTFYPQVIYVPSKIDNKDIYSIDDNFFMNIVDRFDINVKRFFVSPGIKNIGKNVFSINYNMYSNVSDKKSYYKLPFLEVVLPDSIEYIDDSAFKMEKVSGVLESRSNMLFYVYKDSYAYNYAINNGIDYLYIDSVNINLDNTEYKAFDTVDLDDLSIKVNYSGSIDSRSEVIDSYTIKYNNEYNEFRYGDNSFIVEFDTKVGYHIEKEISVVVNKITPEYEVPTGLNGIIGRKLSDIELPLNFEWMDSEYIIDELGDITFKVKYVPDDTDNYEIIEDIDVLVNVTDGKEYVEPEIIISDKIYDGTNQIDLNKINISNLNDDEYTIEDVVLTNINVGQVIAIIRLKLSEEKFLQYKFSNGLQVMNFKVNVNIVPEKLLKPVLVDKEYIYNKEEQIVELENFDNEKMDITGNKRTDVGEYDVIITLKNSNYVWDDDTNEDVLLKFRIDKAVLPVKDETVSSHVFVYDGEYHSIDVKLDSEEDIIIKYMDKDGEYILDEIPKYIDVGTYLIKYKLYIDSNYTEYYGEKELIIVPQELVKPTLVDKEYVYNGSEQVVELNNFDSNIMDISGNKRIDVGEQDVIISLKNSNYIWVDDTSEDVLLKFRIDKANLIVDDNSKDVIVKYDGKYHSVDMDLKYDDGIIIKYMDKDGEYTLDEIPKYIDVGRYVIKYKLYIDSNYIEYYGEKILEITYNTIINNSSDYIGVYDGVEHSFNIDIEALNYKIKYSINNTDYDLDEIPKFKDIGEYIVNYKITAKGYTDLVGSNKVVIYGIKYIDSSLSIKDSILVSRNNSFKNVIDKINIYSDTHIYKHFNIKNEIVSNDILKTGDSIKIILDNLTEYKYNVSILGDVNGDGIINSADLLRVRQHLLGIVKLDNSFYVASDINDDNVVNSADLLRVRQHLLGVNVIK